MSSPKATPETAPYWDAANEGRLSIQRCTPCGRPYFYPRPNCPHCGSAKVEWFDASGRARLVSYIINRRPAPGFEDVSPVIALVELEEGPRMLTNIVGVAPEPEQLLLDMPLTVAFESRGGQAVPVFAPTDAR
ncbi:Zn-ribbon domain-containing OB-fold protein [Streptomyces sp. CA-100214]